MREERTRRHAVGRALAEILRLAEDGDRLAPAVIRRHLELYYGRAVAWRATFGELAAGVAAAGGQLARLRIAPGGPRRRLFCGVRLVAPAALKQRLARWEGLLWSEDLPDEPVPVFGVSGDPGPVLDVLGAPGTLYSTDGVWRQVPDAESFLPSVRGRARPHRHLGHTEQLRAYLLEMDGRGGWGAHPPYDRHIVELAAEGHTVLEVASTLGVDRNLVWRRIKAHRELANIAGPGRGR